MAVFNPFSRFSSPSVLTLAKPAIRNTSVSRSSTTSFLDAFRTVATQQAEKNETPTLAVDQELPALRVTLRKDVKLQVPNLIQGHNECGPTSMAMLMKYNGVDPGNYHKMFYSDTVGHGPLALRSKAINKGLTVRQENYGSLEDLRALVDKGIPAMVLGIYGGGKNSSLSNYIDNASRAHWMVVTGYKTDDSGKITHIYFNDPNRSKTQCWTATDFKKKFWDNNIIPGGHRYYMAVTKKGSFQESCLKKILPSDKLSSSFATRLKTVHNLEKSFYAAEKAADEAKDVAQNVWGEVSGWFS